MGYEEDEGDGDSMARFFLWRLRRIKICFPVEVTMALVGDEGEGELFVWGLVEGDFVTPGLVELLFLVVDKSNPW